MRFLAKNHFFLRIPYLGKLFKNFKERIAFLQLRKDNNISYSEDVRAGKTQYFRSSKTSVFRLLPVLGMLHKTGYNTFPKKSDASPPVVITSFM